MFQSCYHRGVLTSLQVNVSSAVAPLPAQQTQSDAHEQSPRPPSSPLSSQNTVCLGVCDGFNRDNIDDTNGRANGNAVPRSFNSSIQETQGSVLHREEPITEEWGNGLSQSSDPVSLRTNFSTPTGPKRHQGHVYQGNMEANNLMGTNEQGQSHQLRSSLDGGQLNRMCTALRSLTLRLQISYE